MRASTGVSRANFSVCVREREGTVYINELES